MLGRSSCVVSLFDLDFFDLFSCFFFFLFFISGLSVLFLPATYSELSPSLFLSSLSLVANEWWVDYQK